MPAIPEGARREPLARVLEAVAISDAEMSVILRDASREAERIVDSYGDTFSSRIRRAQLDLARVQREMWATVERQTKVGIGDGVDAAAASSSYLDELMFNQVGGSTTWWRNSMLQTARTGIDSLISRAENGITLSDRVYKNAALSSGQLNRAINAMVVNGASAREIATRVRGFIDPNTPGGASYAAQRLGRTELNNAFHTTAVRLDAEKPWVLAQKWNLSRSHPKADVCDEYAKEEHGLGKPGVYPKNSVPRKPHPQCFCFLTPVTPSDEEFINSFHNGAYDSYIDGKGCASVA